MDDLGDVTGRLPGAIEFARAVGPAQFDPAARDHWRELYEGEFPRPRAGLFGKVTNRRAPQTIRLAMVYTLERSDVIRAEHLRAGAEVWRYCEQSARFIFGDRTGDPVVD